MPFKDLIFIQRQNYRVWDRGSGGGRERKKTREREMALFCCFIPKWLQLPGLSLELLQGLCISGWVEVFGLFCSAFPGALLGSNFRKTVTLAVICVG